MDFVNNYFGISPKNYFWFGGSFATNDFDPVYWKVKKLFKKIFLKNKRTILPKF